MRGILGTIAAGVLASWPLGCGEAVFTCSSDVQCMGAAAGVCQPDGYCSFPATNCPSGQRYGEHSGPQSGKCAGEGGNASSTGDAGQTTGSGSTGEPPEPVVDTGETTTGEAGTLELLTTTGPAVTTSDEVTTDDSTTGEPVDPDLVLWLALDESLGGEVPDASSYMGPGWCEPPGCPALARGVVGQAAAFDGSDDAIVVPHAPWLETTEGFTIATWLRIGDPPLAHQAVLTKPLGLSIANTWEIYFLGPTLYLAMVTGLQSSEIWAPWTASPGEWVHLAGTWDGAWLTLWVDGVLADTTRMTAIEFDEQPILVGADDDHTGSLSGYVLGDLDDVRVYRRALLADEIAALAALR